MKYKKVLKYNMKKDNPFNRKIKKLYEKDLLSSVQFFLDNEIINNKKKRDSFFEFISDPVYFHMSKYIFNEDILFKNQIIFLKYFTLEQQLDLIANSMIISNFLPYFELLPYDKRKLSDRELINNNPNIFHIVHYLFSNEYFEQIDQISHFLNVPLLDIHGKNICLCKKLNEYDFFYNKFESVIPLKPYYDILINFSENKANYLIENNAILFSDEEILHLNYLIHNIKGRLDIFPTTQQFKDILILEQQKYHSFIHYKKIDKNINNLNKKSSIKKI